MLNPILLFVLIILISGCSKDQEEGFIVKASTNNGLTCQNDDTESASPLTSKAIYGEDNRLDWFESPGLTRHYWAKATVALMPATNLVSKDGDYLVSANSYKDFAGLCDGQPFAEQPSAAYCSGFLVSDDLVVTAGHCIRDASDCADTYFVFDFAKESADQEEYLIPNSSVYSCAEVVASETGTNDFAVIRLDRAVIDRTPLNIRRQGSIERGSQVMLIGHPMGLPSKIADGGFVQSVGNTISASVDALAANSGSVILNSETGLAEGILVAGEVDFIFQNGCRVEAKCGANCNGEVITPISKLLSYIPEVVYDNPICD